MKLNIAIDSDNAAFEDNGQEEIARILSSLADDIRCYSDAELSGVLRDVNGNRVGYFKFVA